MNSFISKLPAVELAPEEQAALVFDYKKNGNYGSWEKVLSSMYRLVVSIIKNDFTCPQHVFEDAFQEGVLGLMEAIERFEAGKASLATYASEWIKNKVRTCLVNAAHQTTTKNHVEIKRAKARDEIMKFAEEHGRDPSFQEFKRISSLPQKNLFLYFSGAGTESSIDDEKGEARHEVMFSEGDISPLEHLDKKEVCEKVNEALGKLDARDREVLTRRNRSPKAETLYDIGESWSLSYERVRQIEEKAREKFKRAFAKLV